MAKLVKEKITRGIETIELMATMLGYEIDKEKPYEDAILNCLQLSKNNDTISIVYKDNKILVSKLNFKKLNSNEINYAYINHRSEKTKEQIEIDVSSWERWRKVTVYCKTDVVIENVIKWLN